MNVGFIIGGLISVLVVTYFGIPATWFFEGVIVIGTAVFLFVFGEEWFKRKKVAFLSTLKSTLNKTREGLVYYILGTFILMFQGILNLTWQPIFVDSGIQPAMIGLVLSLAGFIGIFTPMLSKKFLAVCRTEKNALIVYSTLLPLFTILLALSHNPVFVVLTYFLVSIIIDIGHPVELKLIHMFTESGMER
jgi:predicted MFS family arabinose efflux permease